MLTTLLVVDDESQLVDLPANAITFRSYLRDYPKLGEPKLRIINLCDTERYLSQGYYCSLLAEARRHQVLPSVRDINALRGDAGIIWMDGKEMSPLLEPSLPGPTQLVCMGEVADPRFKKLAQKAFLTYPAPLLRMSVIKDSAGTRLSVTFTHLAELTSAEREFCLDCLKQHTKVSWRKASGRKKYRWELAMLVNPEEKVPPSNRGALSRFIKAGEKLGIRVTQVVASELHHLGQFDGLFIRETTAIDHHTFRLARAAEKQGLVVMDDPDSILRCCNKVFLHDAFNYQKVPCPPTEFISNSSDETVLWLEQQFGYPMVLKMPEGSFSKGVFKVNSRDELKNNLTELLSRSAIVLAQRYMYTDYDWRVGVLNGRAIYACRYYMARNHWQIYNHESKRNFSGGFDTLPTFELPKTVLNAALKAAAVVGNGLYGIDIKEVDGKAYVLEVNDNPSIDHGVEDAYLGEELYMQIMSEFLRRLEARGR
jgi:glutathione synthase/RimK-type ligase-like ATP-grasp enzyme